MNTPVADFVKRYVDMDIARLHMPGHKGKPFLGCEHLDITEVKGADALFEAEGILAESEANATELFGSRRTCYSTEGSSHAIRAMLYLALTNRPAGASSTVVAARNVHRAFVSAAALLDLDVVWLWPEESHSLCGCKISTENLERTLGALSAPPAAVYLTSPDYLGSMADLPALADVCHRHGTLLAVDNAHGAYLRFLRPSQHPVDLGADICCDSAHKTLPVLTGGAYLHIAKTAPQTLADNAKTALALFGSTSPSYLTLESLDLCNRYLAEGYAQKLLGTIALLEALKSQLNEAGWQVEPGDPLRLTVRAPQGLEGTFLAEQLRREKIECEYADEDFLVLMVTPENTPDELARVQKALGKNQRPPANSSFLPLAKGRRVCSIRQALFSAHELIPAAESLGRICGIPTVGCPPAVPIAVAGEEITPAALELFERYNVKQVDVLRNVRLF